MKNKTLLALLFISKIAIAQQFTVVHPFDSLPLGFKALSSGLTQNVWRTASGFEFEESDSLRRTIFDTACQIVKTEPFYFKTSPKSAYCRLDHDRFVESAFDKDTLYFRLRGLHGDTLLEKWLTFPYPNQYNALHYVHQVSASSDGTIWATFTDWYYPTFPPTNYIGRIFFIRYNSQGDTMLVKQLNAPLNFVTNAVFLLAMNGGQAIAKFNYLNGFSLWVKIDGSGSEVWSENYSDTFITQFNYSTNEAGEEILYVVPLTAGVGSSGPPSVQKRATNGALVWTKKAHEMFGLSSYFDAGLSGIFNLKDNGTALAGVAKLGGQRTTFLTRLDSAGTVLWTKLDFPLVFSPTKLIETPGCDGFFLAGPFHKNMVAIQMGCDGSTASFDQYCDVELTASTDTVLTAIGQKFPLSLFLKNIGKLPAEGLTVQISTVGAANYFNLVSSAATGGIFNSATIQWTFQALAPGDSARLDLELKTINLPVYANFIAWVSQLITFDLDSGPNTIGYDAEDDGVQIPLRAVSPTSANLVETGFQISPNPTSGPLLLRFEKDISEANLLIFNQLGQIVFSKKSIQQSDELDLGDLPNGVYFLKIGTANGQLFSKKVVVTQG